MLGGVVTPTEAGLLAVVYALGLGLLYRELRWGQLVGVMRETLYSTCTIMFLIAPATMRSRLMGVLTVSIGTGPIGMLYAGFLADWIGAHSDERAWVGLPLLAAGRALGALRFSFTRQQKISQEDGVFLEALQSRTRFYGDASALRSWLFRIARNNLIDHWRRAQRARSESYHEIEESELARSVVAEDPEDTAIVSLDRQRLRAGIDTLSADQQEVVKTLLFDTITLALQATWELIRTVNQYIVKREPWSLAKRPDQRGVKARTRTNLCHFDTRNEWRQFRDGRQFADD